MRPRCGLGESVSLSGRESERAGLIGPPGSSSSVMGCMIYVPGCTILTWPFSNGCEARTALMGRTMTQSPLIRRSARVGPGSPLLKPRISRRSECISRDRTPPEVSVTSDRTCPRERERAIRCHCLYCFTYDNWWRDSEPIVSRYRAQRPQAPRARRQFLIFSHLVITRV